LSILDYLAHSRGILDIKGVKLDFTQAVVARTTIELPANMGIPGAVVADSSPMQILQTMSDAIKNQIVQVDLKEGDEWWVTRLMVLCAGATRVGSPKAIVFVGTRSNSPGTFLGWCPPGIILDVLTADRELRGPANITYGSVYERTIRITQQLAIFTDDGAPPPPAPLGQPWTVPVALTPEVSRYLVNQQYTRLGAAALEQILMDQLGRYGLEALPDRLTLSRLEQLFAHCLYRDAIDTQSSKKKQTEVIVQSNAPYIAVVSAGSSYKALVPRVDIDRAVINELLQPSSKN
jgi:hypothetical protein